VVVEGEVLEVVPEEKVVMLMHHLILLPFAQHVMEVLEVVLGLLTEVLEYILLEELEELDIRQEGTQGITGVEEGVDTVGVEEGVEGRQEYQPFLEVAGRDLKMEAMV
jgi:hypothetical protein